MSGYIGDIGIINDLASFKVVLYDNCMWITNYIKINQYMSDEIRLKVKNNVLVIQGLDMRIKMLEKREMILEGKFYGIFLEKFHKGENNEKGI